VIKFPQKKIPNDTHLKNYQKIQKNIHFIYVLNPISEKYIENIKTYINCNKDYKIYLWVDDVNDGLLIDGVEVINIKNLDMFNRDIYDKVSNPGEKSDILRYEIIYQYGGMYSDVDSVCMRSLDDLFENSYLAYTLIYWNNVANGFFTFSKNSSFLRFVLECLRENYNSYDWKTTPERSGPTFLTTCLIQEPKGVSLIDQSKIINGKDPNSYTIHTMDASWQRGYENFNDVDFIEIGTSNFNTLIEKSENEIGYCLEPIESYLKDLPNKKGVKKFNVAVTSNKRDSYVDLYYIPENIIKEKGLFSWFRGTNKIGDFHPLHIQYNLQEIVKKIKVKVVNIDEFLKNQKIRKIKFLKIDTEGHDVVILDGLYNYIVDLPRDYYPLKIQFETNENTKKELVLEILDKYDKIGYQIESVIDSDTTISLR